MKRYRILILLAICVFVQLSSTAETLKGSIEKVWTVDSARKEAFKTLKPWIDLSWAPPVDPNLIENKQAINNHENEIGDRRITLFSDGGYGVVTLDDDNYDKAYYYNPAGELFAIDFLIFPSAIHDLESYYAKQELQQIYPIRNYKHAYPSGKIVYIALTVNAKEIYGFKPSGELAYHWINSNCYDINGRKIMTQSAPKN